MDQPELIPHLFRTEYRKIVSVLCKRFGFAEMQTAEDIVSDTFLTAVQSWGVEGIPANPPAWLYSVARYKAINHLNRDHTFRHRITPAIRGTPPDPDGPVSPEEDIDLSPQNINDSQLQMMFAICHPCIPSEAQIGLSLRILCGFGIEEIADAFLTNKETMNKRLFRAKEKLREARIPIGLPGPADIGSRLDNVLRTIYLLFNEGYYSISQDQTIRKDLCFEAMRLCTMLIENRTTNQPSANALLSLMCFHASRLDARVDDKGGQILYEQQDASRWNTDLISKGGYFLQCAAGGPVISKYHLEAGIAYWNTQKADTQEKWDNILQFYNKLLQIEYSPIAALNRTYALYKANGRKEAIIEAEQLNLTDNHFYFTLLGELYTGSDTKKAREYYQRALSLARTQSDKQSIQHKIDKLYTYAPPE